MSRYILFLSVFVLFACKGAEQQKETDQKTPISQAELKSQIDQLEQELRSDTSGKIDKEKAKVLIEKSLKYIEAYPTGSLNAEYLFRTGELYVGIEEYDKAIKLWEKLREEYKGHDKSAIALFLQGFTCESQMNDIANAKIYYNAFLRFYPDHPYVDQVRMLLKNIDTSPEKLIKSFQEKGENGE